MISAINSFIFLPNDIFFNVNNKNKTLAQLKTHFYFEKFNEIEIFDLFSFFLKEENEKMLKISSQFSNFSKKDTLEFYLKLYKDDNQTKIDHFMICFSKLIDRLSIDGNKIFIIGNYDFGFKSPNKFNKFIDNITLFQNINIDDIKLEERNLGGDNVFTINDKNILLTFHKAYLTNETIKITT